MIKVEPCKGCSSVLLVDEFMGVRVRCNPAPLDTPAAGQALVGGQSLYRVVYEGGRPHSFASASPAILGALRGTPGQRPVVVAQHRCTKDGTKNAVPAPQGASQKVGGTGTPKALQSPPVGHGVPFSGHSSPSSPTALTADTPNSEQPRCSGCGQPCADGTFSAIHLGDLLVWASHVDGCE